MTAFLFYLATGLVVFLITLNNYKQLSYFSRIVLFISFTCIGYVGFYVVFVIYYGNPTAQTLRKGESVFTAPYYNKPFFPNFFDLLAQDTFSFEGIAMVPALYCNARNQHSVHRTIGFALLLVALPLSIYCPMCYIAFGNNTQYMVLMNLGQGIITEAAKVSYAVIVTTYNLGINMYPIFDILESKIKEFKKEENLQCHEKVLASLGENKYALRILAIFCFLPICPSLDGISLLMMLNGFFCINFF